MLLGAIGLETGTKFRAHRPRASGGGNLSYSKAFLGGHARAGPITVAQCARSGADRIEKGHIERTVQCGGGRLGIP